MLSKVTSVGIFGLHTFPVETEVYLTPGKYRFDIVGLPDAAVSEAKERVWAAVKNNGFGFSNNSITVNLAPADVRKEGSIYDLPVFIALVSALKKLPSPPKDYCFVGELSLAGDVRSIRGVMPMVLEARKNGVRRMFVPYDNIAEASVADNIDVYGIRHVKELLNFLWGGENDTELTETLVPVDKIAYVPAAPEELLDFADVKGQKGAKRALETAAAGGHNLMMVGPPGSGKSMLAKRLPSILPDMTFEEALDTTKIYSVAGLLGRESGLVRSRPFRSPHHTVSSTGLAGGGSVPRPGEISLAHNGVLFLDELPEFSRTALEVMRQPIEDGEITISRVAGSLTYPCSIMLVAAMNPCPCGYLGHPTHPCSCSPGMAAKYLARVSGPLLDRIDIQVEVPPVNFDELNAKKGNEETSAEIKKRVDAARQIQARRFAGTPTTCNAKMTAAQTHEFCRPTPAALELLRNAFDKLGLSARAYDRILRVARTVADLDGVEEIDVKHVSEAIKYRTYDRQRAKKQ